MLQINEEGNNEGRIKQGEIIKEIKKGEGMKERRSRRIQRDMEAKEIKKERRLLCVLAVGLLAFDQVGSFQRDSSEQASGPAVGENGGGAAQSHVSLHVPEEHKVAV